MTMQIIALVGAEVLMLVILVRALRSRRAAGADAHEELERPTPLLAQPTSLPAADDGAQAHMGPPAPEPMEWPPFSPSTEAAAASEAAAAREPLAKPAATRPAAPEPARAWAPDEVIDAPGWPTPGEMDMGWGHAIAGAVPVEGIATRLNGGGAHHSSDGVAPQGLLSDSPNGFDPAAGWRDDPASGETAELERVTEHAEHVAAEQPPLDGAPPEDQVDRAWAAFANDEPVPPMVPGAPEQPQPEQVVERVWEIPAPSVPVPVVEPAWAMPAPSAAEPEVVAPQPVWAMPPPEDEVALEAEVALAPEPPSLAVVPDPDPAPLPVPAPTLHVVAEPASGPGEDALEPAWYEPPTALDPEGVSWWDEADFAPPELAREAGVPTSGRFALGGFALQPGHEALTGVTFRAPLEAAPQRWELAGVDPVPPGTLVLELDGALNCEAADLAVLTAAGFAPSPEGFTLRVAARASGPFAASGTFRIAA